jgi:hypothetical protein
MTDRMSPQFHAEIIVLLFDEYRDLRKGRRRSEFYSRTRRPSTSKLFATSPAACSDALVTV